MSGAASVLLPRHQMATTSESTSPRITQGSVCTIWVNACVRIILLAMVIAAFALVAIQFLLSDPLLDAHKSIQFEKLTTVLDDVLPGPPKDPGPTLTSLAWSGPFSNASATASSDSSTVDGSPPNVSISDVEKPDLKARAAAARRKGTLWIQLDMRCVPSITLFCTAFNVVARSGPPHLILSFGGLTMRDFICLC